MRLKKIIETMPSIRLLPLAMIAGALVLGIKLGNIASGTAALFSAREVHAETASTSTPESLGDAAAGPGKDAAEGPQSEGSTSDAASTQGDSETSADEGKTGEDILPDVNSYTKGELELLQDLSKRRQELDARKNGLDMRDRVLQVTEQRINEKLAQLKAIEVRIQGLLTQYDSQQEKRLASLVKVYETMKPKDAARIFNSLDLNILIPVAERMKESKIASILAKMNGAAAKALTVELATRQEIPAPQGDDAP